MAAERVSDAMAADIANSIGNPLEADIPTWGINVVYQNHRYLLTMKEGKYIAFDVSVYGITGMLLTDSTDIWLDVLLATGRDSLDDLKKAGIGIGLVAVVGILAYLLGNSRNG